MNTLLSIVVRIAAVFYAATTGAALYKVLNARETGLSPVQAGIVAAVAGLLCQLGLLVAPSTVHRRGRARAAAGMLMLPGLVLLAALLVGAVQRWPRAIGVAAVAAIGLGIYAGQYAVLWHAGQVSKRLVEPAP